MARPPRSERKAELLAAILDYLMDKTLAELTFRSLAEGLGISAYVLVYPPAESHVMVRHAG